MKTTRVSEDENDLGFCLCSPFLYFPYSPAFPKHSILANTISYFYSKKKLQSSIVSLSPALSQHHRTSNFVTFVLTGQDADDRQGPFDSRAGSTTVWQRAGAQSVVVQRFCAPAR